MKTIQLHDWESRHGTLCRLDTSNLCDVMAANLRNLGDNFAQKSMLMGSEALAMLNAALKTYQRQLETLKRN